MKPAFAVLVLLLGCSDVATPPETPTQPSTDGSRPNVLLILTDDQDVGTLFAMPRVGELLADQGVTFSNAFVTTSFCCPSRASILRGQYAHNHGVLTNALPAGGHEVALAQGLEESTLATWLHHAGYRTAWIGKYLNGYGQEDAA